MALLYPPKSLNSPLNPLKNTVAKKHDLPLILHTRKAEARTFEILQEMGVTKADFHCFCGKAKLGKKVRGWFCFVFCGCDVVVFGWEFVRRVVYVFGIG